MRPDILVSHPGNPRVYDMVAALVRAGFQVRFATGYYFDPAGPEARLSAGLQATLRRRSHFGIAPAIVDRSFGGEAIKRALGAVAANDWFDRHAARLVRRLRPRLVIAAESCALHAFRAGASVGAKCILDQVIGFEGEGARLLREEVARHPALADTVEIPDDAMIARCRAEALAADVVLAPSDYVRNTMRDIGVPDGRLALLPYGADLTRFKPGPRRDRAPLRILFAGQIGARKGVHYLLEAFRLAAPDDTELVLAGAVLGGGAWLAPYRGLYRHVPHVPHSQVHRLFQDADIYVFPSLYEGSSVSILEAMASGLPVVTTPNAGSVVTDGKDGFIVSIRDSAALADRITRLANDAVLRVRMGEAGRRTAEAHDLAQYERDLARMVNALLTSED